MVGSGGVEAPSIGPYALPAGKGWTYHFAELGIDFVVKVAEQRHGRGLAVFELTTRSGEEPPLHTHATEDEIFYVLSGDLAFRCGDDRFEVSTGGCVLLPRGIQHGYQVTSAGDVRLLVLTAPVPEHAGRGWGGFVGSFEEHSELRNSPPGTNRVTAGEFRDRLSRRRGGATRWPDLEGATMRASRSTRVSGGIVGVQFLTAVAPGSPPAEALSALQRSLGGPHPRPGEAALFFADADGGSTGVGPQVVGLWVPIDQQVEAEDRLRDAGFVVS